MTRSLAARLPEIRKDNRQESRNVDQGSIQLLGKLAPEHRSAFIEPAIVGSTKKERLEGRSLALIRPADPIFFHRKRDKTEIERRRSLYNRLLASPDMFGANSIIPLVPAPFEFGYRYRDDDGEHECLCHDWEVEQTFVNWRRDNNEQKTLDLVHSTFGGRYVKEGFVLAMGINQIVAKGFTPARRRGIDLNPCTLNRACVSCRRVGRYAGPY